MHIHKKSTDNAPLILQTAKFTLDYKAKIGYDYHKLL